MYGSHTFSRQFSFLIIMSFLFNQSFAASKRPANPHLRGREISSINSDQPPASQEPTPTASSTPTPTPDAELERLKRETDLAEARQAKAEADKAEADARKAAAEADREAAKTRLGLGDESTAAKATAPSGSITGDTSKFIETQLLAETAARVASIDLADQLCAAPYLQKNKKKIKKLVVVNGMDKAAIESYNAIVAQLAEINETYTTLINNAHAALCSPPDFPPDKCAGPAVPASLIVPAITETVKSVADLVNLFRTETEFKNQQVQIDEQTIVTSIVNRLLTQATTTSATGNATPQINSTCEIDDIYYPSIYPLSISANSKDSALLQVIKELKTNQSRGDAAVKDNEDNFSALEKKVKEMESKISEIQKKISDKKEQIAALEKSKPLTTKKKAQIAAAKIEQAKAEADLETLKKTQGDEHKRKMARLKLTSDDLKNFKAAVAEISNLLTAVDATTKQSTLVGILRSERLARILDEDDTYALDLKSDASGTTRIRKNIFWNARADHTGGVSIKARLFDKDDKLVFGTVTDYYFEYTGSGHIRKARKFKKLEEVSEDIRE